MVNLVNKNELLVRKWNIFKFTRFILFLKSRHDVNLLFFIVFLLDLLSLLFLWIGGHYYLATLGRGKKVVNTYCIRTAYVLHLLHFL